MPILNTYITSGYGGRADPFGGGRAFHKGIDFHARTGDPVLAVADGVVSFSGRRSGYGTVVDVDHGNGYVTRYAHNSRLGVQVGDLVRSGQQIAKAGSTGRSTGAHVHFEVWQDGRVLNPRRSEEHTSELQSLMRISYAVFCFKKKKPQKTQQHHIPHLLPHHT